MEDIFFFTFSFDKLHFREITTDSTPVRLLFIRASSSRWSPRSFNHARLKYRNFETRSKTSIKAGKAIGGVYKLMEIGGGG